MAMSDAVKQALWIRGLLTELHIAQGPTTIHEDNQGCIAISKHRHRTTGPNIDVRYHHIRDHLELKRIVIRYCPSDQQLADVLTKPACAQRIKACR